MTRLSRRQFVSVTVGSAVAVGAGCSGGSDDDGATDSEPGSSTTAAPVTPVELPDPPFTLGVASGDPLEDSVILWTRLAPDPLNGGGMPDAAVAVDWEVATDQEFTDVVASGSAVAEAALGHSVHVDASGLSPDTWYWYRFSAGGHQSAVGKTRTTPAADSDPEELRFAFASCQNYQSGFYTAYPHLVADAPDVILFLGDYIYESGRSDDETAVRYHEGDEVDTLEKYRNRYALYKSDVNLQDAHAACPWLMTWDDHEVDNNYAGMVAELSDEGEVEVSTEDFTLRRAAAYQAYYEHQPMRIDPPTDENLAIYRASQWGSLAQFFVIDTRQYRDDQVCPILIDPVADPNCAEIQADDRQMLGPEQEDWLVAGLRASSATWNVLANQVVFSPMPLGPVINGDQWDAYPAQRDRILAVFGEEGVNNPVVITGDIHSSGAGNLLADVSQPETSAVVGAEFVGTSITSSGGGIEEVEAVIGLLSWVKYIEPRKRGYVMCHLTAEGFRAEFRHLATVLEETSDIATDKTFVITAGIGGITEV